MKPRYINKLSLLEELLKSAYRKREKGDLSRNWQLRILTEVRLQPVTAVDFNYLENFSRFAWRLAIIGASLACLLIAYYFVEGSAPEVERIEQFIIDPGRSLISQIWNLN